jgi:PEP-CTERM motif
MKTQSYLVKTAVAGVLGLSMAGSANAIVAFGDGGTALQGVLDNITVGGPSSVNVVTDQFSPDHTWAITGSGGSISTMIIELAGFAGSNSFGVYDATNPANSVQIFSGPQGAGSQASLAILADGSVVVNFVDTGIDFAGGNAFGFYLNVAATGQRWYSDSALNTDGMDHMAAYQGNNVDTIQIPPFSAGTWTSNEYIQAWEDLDASVADRDYTDFVVIVESVKPIPEPGILALLGLGLLGLVGGRRFTKTA